MLDDILYGFCWLLVAILFCFSFYALIWGPDVNKIEKIDDRCQTHIYHDHRLFEADKPEKRTVYCVREL